MKIRDDFLYRKDRCRDRLNSVTPKEGPSDRRYENIILQCLPPEYDRIRQMHFERENCSLADIWRMMPKIYADNIWRMMPKIYADNIWRLMPKIYADNIWRMMPKIYADNLARSHSDPSRGIAGRGVAIQATGRDLSKINRYNCNKFGHYKNDCADFKAAHHQNRRRRQRHHKQRGGHQPD